MYCDFESSTPAAKRSGEALELVHAGPFRLIIDGGRDGPHNMARDEAMSQRSERPVVRFYAFRPATLSLGRFQAASTVDLERARRDGLSVVRRPTGGQAVLHDNELTYSVVIARSHVRDFRKREIYRLISDVLAEGMARFGVKAGFALTRAGSARNPDCFATTGEYELSTPDGRKLVGSAQATTRRACLQHGSIPLDGSFRRISEYLRAGAQGSGPGPTSLGEEIGRAVSLEEAAAVFASVFAESFGAEPSELTAAEEALSRSLVREKYGSDAWTLMY
jgi:lipoate-protein ligase A